MGVGGLGPRTGLRSRHVAQALGVLALSIMSACSMGNPFGPSMMREPPPPILPDVQGEVLGTGPVRVAMLLPLSGDPSLTNVGTSMANAARIALQYIGSNQALPDNITIVLKDTGASPDGAALAASQAVAEGASLILGPLRADQVTAVAGVAKPAGIPVIGFSNNTSVAQPGVWLLNVLPDSEVKRTLGFAKTRGKTAVAAIVPTTEFGRVQGAAFDRAVSTLGLVSGGTTTFSSETEARAAVATLARRIQAGEVTALFIPDRATAPSIGALLLEAGVPQGKVQLIGSADWNNDSTIANTPYLAGAIYPATDDAGYKTLSTDYQAMFARPPHQLATVAYTAVILANATSLAMANPKYPAAQLTTPNGFNGRDGVFRFLPDGRSEYALVIKEVTPGGSRVVDTAKL